jgi:hypothetical protein
LKIKNGSNNNEKSITNKTISQKSTEQKQTQTLSEVCDGAGSERGKQTLP